MSDVLSPELDLLLACGSPPSESAQARISGLLAGPLDWPRLAELAGSHGLLSLLARALPAQSPAAAQIRAQADDCALRSLRLAGELTKILGVMEKAGLTPIAFKGPALAWLAYGDLALRHFNDLDLFVPRLQLEAALDLLETHGFAKKPAWDAGFSGACEVVLRHGQTACEVDLHWLFSSPYFLPFDPVRAMERSIVLRSGGFAARTLCPEDHLLYLCIHAAREGWPLARIPCDIAGLAARCALDWDDLILQAERTGCWRALAAGLALAHELCEAPIPPVVLRRVKQDRMVSRISAEARLGLIRQGTTTGAQQHLRTLEGWRAKARYLWRRALQPNQLDAEWITLPRRLLPAYYVIRPVRLACTALGRLRRA